ncbi:MAG TPA: SelB C-terminal domain-containing protein, partial [Desulfopila sp.]|nr:SelB C-terminal domain-containing protein [Desulfopila sp.]
MVEEEWLEMVDEEVRDFCQGSFLEEAPVIHVSSTTGEGIDEVKKLLDSMVANHRFEEVFGPFRLPVDRVFAMKGFGAVVTGTSISGRIAVGEELQIYPTSKTAKVRGIQVHSHSVDMVEAGHRTAINLQGVETLDIARGMVVANPASLTPNYMLDCSLSYLSSNDKPLKHRARVRVHLGTAEVMGRVSLLDRDVLQPGDSTGVQLLLEEPLAVWPGDRYVIRSYSPVITIGGGEVLGNVSLRKRKRFTAKDREKNTEAFAILENGSDEDRILLFLKESGTRGLLFDELAIRLGIFGKQLKKVLNEPLSKKSMIVVDSSAQRYLEREVSEGVMLSIVTILEKFHSLQPLQTGLSKEGLRSELGRRLDQRVFAYCLNELIKNNKVVQEDSLVRLSSHEVALKADEEQLQKELIDWYRQKGLTTATLKETQEQFGDYPSALLKEVIGLLLREGKLVKVSETLYYDSGVITALQHKVVTFMEREKEIDAPRFKDMTGLTRKFSIPILEYFDRIKLTYRVGDKRILRKQS